MVDVATLQNGNFIWVNNRLFMVNTVIRNAGESPIINGTFQDGLSPVVGDFIGSECDPIELKPDLIEARPYLMEDAQKTLNINRTPYYHELQNYLKFISFT